MPANQALGDFLRSRRARVRPDNMSDAELRRRRTPGLKREEVALRAGISSEWYVKLEQGRAGSPSSATVEALVGALNLDETEAEHLRSIASAGRREPFEREVVPETLRQIVAELEQPAYITGERFDLLAWNDAAASLFGDMLRLNGADRNVLAWMLTSVAAREIFGERWTEEARRIVFLFRAAYDRWQGDAAFEDLVAQVRGASVPFDKWWSDHGVGAPLSGFKTLRHPTEGETRYAVASFQANDDPALKLALYTRCDCC